MENPPPSAHDEVAVWVHQHALFLSTEKNVHAAKQNAAAKKATTHLKALKQFSSADFQRPDIGIIASLKGTGFQAVSTGFELSATLDDYA